MKSEYFSICPISFSRKAAEKVCTSPLNSSRPSLASLSPLAQVPSRYLLMRERWGMRHMLSRRAISCTRCGPLRTFDLHVFLDEGFVQEIDRGSMGRLRDGEESFVRFLESFFSSRS